jgi:hypothetical protein
MMRAAELGETYRLSQFIVMIPTGIARVVTIVGTGMILRTDGSALTTWTTVRNHEDYKRSVEGELSRTLRVSDMTAFFKLRLD